MRLLQSPIRRVVSVAALSLVGCVTVPQNHQVDLMAVNQWESVESSSPLIAAAYMQSLIALTEDGPAAAVAREQAFLLARQCGLVIAQRHRPTCELCNIPVSQGANAHYLHCLAKRLNCLTPP